MAKWHRKKRIKIEGRRWLPIATIGEPGLGFEAPHGGELPETFVQGSDPRLIRPVGWYFFPGGSGEGGGGPTEPIYWQDVLKNSTEPTMSLLDALGDWVEADHRSITNASGTMYLQPKAGQSLLIGEVGGAAGSARKFAWGDNPSAQTDIWCYWNTTAGTAPTGSIQKMAHFDFKFTWDNATKQPWALNAISTILDPGRADRVSGLRASAVSLSSVTAPLLEGLSASAGTFSGSSNVTLARGGAYYIDHLGAGTIATGIALAVLNANGAGPITTQIGLDIPALTRGMTNYGMRLGANTHLLNGVQSWLYGGDYYSEFRHDSGGTGIMMRFVRAHTGASPTPKVRFLTSRGTLASPAAISNNDVLYTIEGWGYGATGWSAAAKAWVGVAAAENWTDAAQGTYLTFGVTPTGSTTAAVYMRIAGSGSYLGATTSQPCGFHGVSAAQAAHIANPTGGTPVDGQARAAINAILVVLENKGLTATS